MSLEQKPDNYSVSLTLKKTVASDLLRAANDAEVSLATYTEQVLLGHVREMREQWQEEVEKAAAGVPTDIDDNQEAPLPQPAEDLQLSKPFYEYKVHHIRKGAEAFGGSRQSTCGYWLNSNQPGTFKWAEVTCRSCLKYKG